MAWYSSHRWSPYVSVAERRRRAAQKVAKMQKQGREVSPIEITGRNIATTFWGDAWCQNLERYSDYENRLPRGRTYVRNGSVIDLQIEAGRVRALVCGSELYQVDIEIKRLHKSRWIDIKGRCAGQIDSLVELLKGSISKGVMEIVTREGEGLFPSPKEIELSCSCPDWATMCKHVAATLYGVGARLDHEPEMLFTLRGVDPTEMVEAAIEQPPAIRENHKSRVLASDDLSSLFGIDINSSALVEQDIVQKSKRVRKAAARDKKKPVSTTNKKTKAKAAVKKTAIKQRKKKTAVRKTTNPRKSNAKKAATKKTTQTSKSKSRR